MKKLLDFVAKYPNRVDSEPELFREVGWLWIDHHSNLPDTQYSFTQLGICDFLVGHPNLDETEIYIRLRRPGLLIGKGGGCIDFIRAKMIEKYNRKFTFVIDEPPSFLF